MDDGAKRFDRYCPFTYLLTYFSVGVQQRHRSACSAPYHLRGWQTQTSRDRRPRPLSITSARRQRRVGNKDHLERPGTRTNRGTIYTVHRTRRIH